MSYVGVLGPFLYRGTFQVHWCAVSDKRGICGHRYCKAQGRGPGVLDTASSQGPRSRTIPGMSTLRLTVCGWLHAHRCLQVLCGDINEGRAGWHKHSICWEVSSWKNGLGA